jgi:uncharacterized protein (DUF362 family)/NAD-dependent dihydropyrimidine dehydrogenase PreA subunit
MSKTTVALIRCPNYDPDEVEAALRRGLAHLGGIERFVQPGERIMLKPNILAGDPPARAVTTHPTVLAGMVRVLRDAGAEVCFGDSPGLDAPRQAAERSGLYDAGVQNGARFVEFTANEHLDTSEGKAVKRLPVARVVLDCDGVINLPKMKAHQLTRITGAVKNLFGCIAGRRKALYHVQFQDPRAFSRLLVALAMQIHPRLHVMDGVIAMEGNGPRGGNPHLMQVLILSADPIAVDATFCRLIAMDPGFVPTNTLGAEVGLGTYDREAIEIVGDTLDDLIDPDFKMIRKPVYANATLANRDILKNLLLPKPTIQEVRCIRCGRCVEACPVPGKALHFEDGRKNPPVYTYKRCIRCYCCHEMCPEQAIEKRVPLLGRMLKLG